MGVVIPLDEVAAEAGISRLWSLVRTDMERVSTSTILSRTGSEGHDDPGGRQPSHPIGREEAASHDDARRPPACVGYVGDGHVKLAAARSSSCTPRRCCTTMSSTRATCAAASSRLACSGATKPAVLVGDFLLGQAFRMMVEVGSLPCLSVLADAAAVIAEGEVMQISAAKDTATTEDDYVAVIRAKTAALFAAACEVGPILAGQIEGRDVGLPGLRHQSRHRVPTDRRRARLRRVELDAGEECRRRLPRRQDHPPRGACRSGAGQPDRAGVLDPHAGEGRNRRRRPRDGDRHDAAPSAPSRTRSSERATTAPWRATRWNSSRPRTTRQALLDVVDFCIRRAN